MFTRFVVLISLVGCGDPRVGDVLDLDGDVDAGELVYVAECADCHGADGTGGDGGPPINHGHGARHTVGQILYGGGTMPAFEGELVDQEVADVNAYVQAHIFGDHTN